MSEQPERPAQPGAETHVAKDVVAGVQAALDATFNATNDATREDIESLLRSQLEERGVGGEVSDDWVREAAHRMSAGEPVVAEPGDA